jgi:hypothetical protein
MPKYQCRNCETEFERSNEELAFKGWNRWKFCKEQCEKDYYKPKGGFADQVLTDILSKGHLNWYDEGKCSHCGGSLKSDNNVCESCGKSIDNCIICNGPIGEKIQSRQIWCNKCYPLDL